MAGPISLSLSTKTMRVIVVEATKGSICQPTASVRLSPADLRNVRILAGLMRDIAADIARCLQLHNSKPQRPAPGY